MKVHALVIAGGEGSRLGHVRKADLRIGNNRLIDRVMTRLGPLTGDLLISTGPAAQFPSVPGIALPDPAGLAGPMAGLLAGALYLRDHAQPDDLLITVAVDTPFLPADYIERLVAATGPRPAYASFAGNPYPTNASWPAAVLLDLLAAGPEAIPHSPKRLLSATGAQEVDWAEMASDDPFANLNTLSDLITLSRRAANCDK
jgi:molybdopterin-guanine dinucleotide biosynthesis protein A